MTHFFSKAATHLYEANTHTLTHTQTTEFSIKMFYLLDFFL